MSDGWGSSAALGYLAGSYSGAQTAKVVNELLAGIRERRNPSIDVNALLAVAQQVDAHVAQQNAYIADLERQLLEERERAAEVRKDLAELRAWSDWADVELRKRWNTG